MCIGPSRSQFHIVPNTSLMYDIWQVAPLGRAETTQPTLPTCRASQKEEEETEANIKINRTLGTKRHARRQQRYPTDPMNQGCNPASSDLVPSSPRN